jgi:hypothetical protein
MSSRLSIMQGDFFGPWKGKTGGKLSRISEILIKSRFPAIRAGQNPSAESPHSA